MSKVETLLKLTEYWREHPASTDTNAAAAMGISRKYVGRCRKDIQELSFHFFRSLLSQTDVDLLLSKLDPGVGCERVLLEKLHKAYMGEKDGLIAMGSPGDTPTNEYLQVGLWAPQAGEAHVNFWLERLLYDPLLRANSQGTDYRLASICHSIDGYSKWRIRLRSDIYWSDGKPITWEDVIHSLSRSRLSLNIQEIKKVGKAEIEIILNAADALFCHKLGYATIFPAHSTPYEVTGGPFCLGKSEDPTSFRLYRNRDYYRDNSPKIDWINLRTYTRSAFAVKAVMEKKVDLLPLRTLHQIHQWRSIVPQSFPSQDLAYYLLILNNRSGPLMDRRMVTLLRNSIDYNLISLHLSSGLSTQPATSRHTKGLSDLRLGYLAEIYDDPIHKLVLLMASSLGISDRDVVDVKTVEAADVVDAVLTQVFFGYGYFRLRRYFHSEGEANTFRFSSPRIDSMIDRIDGTSSMQERTALGQEVVRQLQEEGAIILLAPCVDYIFSNLYIAPSPDISSLTDFIRSLPDMRVKRGKNAVKDESKF